MSPVALGLDLLLAGLLIAALAVGIRLNARLKVLRESQAGFAQASIELNQAAARAEAGLASLRAASEEAHDSLLLRIETARQLSAKLEQATIRAERASAGGLSSSDPPQTATLGPLRSKANGPAGGLAALTELAASLRTGPEGVRTRPAEAQATAPPRRGRPAFDDDLFEGGDPPRAVDPAPGPSRRQKGDLR